LLQDPRNNPRSNQENERNKNGQFAVRERQRQVDAIASQASSQAMSTGAQRPRHQGQEHQGKNRHKVLDHEPSERNVTVDSVERIAFFQGA
jgi:hypothetical protein